MFLYQPSTSSSRHRHRHHQYYYGSASGGIYSALPLSKFAEAAGKKMKKLRRNWSLKKSDITRSLSRIKANKRPNAASAAGDVVWRTNKKPVVQVSTPGSSRRHHRRPSFRSSGGVVRCNNSENESGMFYITLNIEDTGKNCSNSADENCSSKSVYTKKALIT